MSKPPKKCPRCGNSSDIGSKWKGRGRTLVDYCSARQVRLGLLFSEAASMFKVLRPFLRSLIRRRNRSLFARMRKNESPIGRPSAVRSHGKRPLTEREIEEAVFAQLQRKRRGASNAERITESDLSGVLSSVEFGSGIRT